VPCELHLDGGDVDAGDAVPPGEFACGGDTTPAAELEDVGLVVQPAVQVADPIKDRRIDTARPFGVTQRNRVVTTCDDLFRIARDRPPPLFSPTAGE
jgi:hypothetical protein